MSWSYHPRLLAIAAMVAGGLQLAASPAAAQSAPSNYTSAIRYDLLGRVTGTIAPDADGAAPFVFTASRSTYDASGNLIRVESGWLDAWQSDTVAPANWGAAFHIDSTVESTFDAVGHKLSQIAKGSDSVPVSLTQFSYLPDGDVECTAVRMNPAAFASPPASACTLGTAGTYGADRITRNVYVPGNPGLVQKVQQAVGTANQRDNVTYTYSGNNKVASITDARGLMATYTYDGFDRLAQWNMPDKVYAQTPSTSDYESYSYDANGNRTDWRLRDNSHIVYAYDVLNRQTSRTPDGEAAVTYGYDLRSLLTGEQRTDGISNTYTFDGFGRLVSEAQAFGTITYQYDANGNQTRMTWGDGFYASYDFDMLNRVSAIRENGATSGVGVLASYAYDAMGRRTAVSFGNGTSRNYAYDTAGRPIGVKIDLAGTAGDLTIGAVAGSGSPITRNPAGQILSITRDNDAYAWTAHSNYERDYAVNGLNQYTSAGGATFAYDARGNLTSSGSSTYSYSKLNELKTAPGANLYYDPKGRLVEFDTTSSTRMVYSGPNLVAELANPSGSVLRRYVHGTGSDEPIVWYEGSGTSDRRFLQVDQLGSVVAVSDASGTSITTNRYDEYGIPQAGNAGRFQYTGQTWYGEIGLYNYKARWYSASLGRFMQTDPIGYKDQINLYAYVGNDPVDRSDPSGMVAYAAGGGCDPTAARISMDCGGTIGSPGALTATEKANATPPQNLPGGPYSPKPQTPGNRPESFQGPSQQTGPRSQAQWVPEGGPSNSKGYWKIQEPGEKGWRRFDQQGKPISPEEAHPGNRLPQQENVPKSGAGASVGGVLLELLDRLLRFPIITVGPPPQAFPRCNDKYCEA